MLNENGEIRDKKAKDENLKDIAKIRDVILLIITCHILTFSNKLVTKFIIIRTTALRKRIDSFSNQGQPFSSLTY